MPTKGYEKLDGKTTNASAVDVNQEKVPQSPASAPEDPNAVPITILTQTGAKIQLRVNLSSTVVDLKGLVEEQSGVEKVTIDCAWTATLIHNYVRPFKGLFFMDVSWMKANQLTSTRFNLDVRFICSHVCENT
jgi:hypothetical protein